MCMQKNVASSDWQCVTVIVVVVSGQASLQQKRCQIFLHFVLEEEKVPLFYVYAEERRF